MIESISNGHKLTFEESRHFYNLDGKKIDSVTGVVKGGYPTSFRLINWMIKEGVKACIEFLKQFPEQVSRLPEYVIEEVLKSSCGASRRLAKEAANIGSLVHLYAEYYESAMPLDEEIHNSIVSNKDRQKIFSCIKKFRRWKRKNNDEIIKHEAICASTRYGIAGKFDRLAKRRNSVVLSDWKTSSGIFTEQFIQLALYTILIEEWFNIKVDAIEIVRFGKEDGEFETKLISDPQQLEELKQQSIRNIETTKFIKKWE